MRSTDQLWALILAGGEGRRLQPLTRRIVGEPRPKQFCAILGEATLLDETRRRVELLIPRDRHMVVVTRAHERYYRYLGDLLPPENLAVQPASRDTAPGILYPLLRLTRAHGNIPVAIFPSDHYVSDDALFMMRVKQAFRVARSRPGLLVLLGMEATSAETEYGWIEPAAIPLLLDGDDAYPIRRFWEKPGGSLARHLFESGCLWNSFVMLGWSHRIIDLLRAQAPELTARLEGIQGRLGSPDEEEALQRVYAELRPTSFARVVLAGIPSSLATIRVKDVVWNDLGNARRVAEWLARLSQRPAWMTDADLAPFLERTA